MKTKSFVLLLLSILAMPAMAEFPRVPSGVYRWSDHSVEVGEDRETREILEGQTPYFSYLEVHATTQAVGATPSEPHANEDIEELIIVKECLVRVTIAEESKVMGAGSVVLLMPQQMHRLENVGDVPLTYFVLRYRAGSPMQLERGVSEGNSRDWPVAETPSRNLRVTHRTALSCCTTSKPKSRRMPYSAPVSGIQIKRCACGR